MSYVRIIVNFFLLFDIWSVILNTQQDEIKRAIDASELAERVMSVIAQGLQHRIKVTCNGH